MTPTLADALKAILTWLRVIRLQPPTLRAIAAEARLIERLAEQLADEIDADAATPRRPVTKRSPRA